MHVFQQDDPPDDEGTKPAVDDSAAMSWERRLAALDAEFALWIVLDTTARHAALREVIARKRQATPEVMVRLCCHTRGADDRPTFSLAFEALATITMRQLITQSKRATREAREEHARDVLLKTLAAIRGGKADYATRYFFGFTRRRSIELHRSQALRFENMHTRDEPTETNEPLDAVPDRAPSAEVVVLASLALDKLPAKQRAAIIQYYRLEMSQEEIAANHGVSVRTVFSWLAKAKRPLGLAGDDND
ncbi:MAG: RNA polymerase sigma factor [Nitrospiraceae bacterium]